MQKSKGKMKIKNLKFKKILILTFKLFFLLSYGPILIWIVIIRYFKYGLTQSQKTTNLLMINLSYKL